MFPYHGQKIKNNNTTPEQPGDNTQDGNENPGENNPGTGTVTTNPKPSNDTNNSSTNNEIISNKEELTTNISRKQNTPKISSNKNSKVIVEDNKQTNTKQNDSVKTGDDTHLFMYVLLELLAFVGIVSLRKKAKKKRTEFSFFLPIFGIAFCFNIVFWCMWIFFNRFFIF